MGQKSVYPKHTHEFPVGDPMSDLAVHMPLRPVLPRGTTRDSEVLRQIRDASNQDQAQRAMEAAKRLALKQQAQAQDERRAEDEREAQLRPRTYGQILAAPFKACFVPTRRS